MNGQVRLEGMPCQSYGTQCLGLGNGGENVAITEHGRRVGKERECWSDMPDTSSDLPVGRAETLVITRVGEGWVMSGSDRDCAVQIRCRIVLCVTVRKGVSCAVFARDGRLCCTVRAVYRAADLFRIRPIGTWGTVSRRLRDSN